MMRVRHLNASLFGLLSTAACMGITSSEGPYAGRGITAPAAVATAVRFTDISAGFFHSCAIDSSGAAWCWGSNEFLQAGSTATQPRCEERVCLRTPVRVGGALAFRTVSSGTTHSCGLTTTGRAACWGGPYPGAPVVLGDEQPVSSASPVLVASDSLFVQVTAGVTHSCALTASGQAFCWGQNGLGQLGDGTTLSRARATPVATAVRFTTIAAGGQHSCGISIAGDALCWGSNRWGQIGAGEVPFNNFGVGTSSPVRVAGTREWRSIGAGGEHSCALAVDGSAWCWGQHGNAQQLGDGSMVTHRGLPVPVQGGRTFASLAVGMIANCGLQADGATWCWGSNYFGALGNGRMVSGGEPAPVPLRGGPWQRVSIGGSHSCGIDAQGVSYCWGDGFYGQTGRGGS
jgi:alpha-tubulin suppressor-like RCC1 family protein